MVYTVRKEDSGNRTHWLELAKVIRYGRGDNEFCSAGCKTRRPNRKTRVSRLLRLRVMHAINKHYEVLSYLLGKGVAAIETATLGQMGFDFTHITGYRKVRKSVEMWCYDIRIIVTETTVKSISRVDIVFEDDSGEPSPGR